jgi:hypothetical protein
MHATFSVHLILLDFITVIIFGEAPQVALPPLNIYEGVSKSFRTGRLERELQMVQLSATRCSCIALLWVTLVSFATITLFVASWREFIVVSVIFRYRLSPETFEHTVVL